MPANFDFMPILADLIGVEMPAEKDGISFPTHVFRSITTTTRFYRLRFWIKAGISHGKVVGNSGLSTKPKFSNLTTSRADYRGKMVWRQIIQTGLIYCVDRLR